MSDYIQQMLNDRSYTFIRVKQGVKGFAILEIRDEVCQWSNDIDTALGWFTGPTLDNQKFLLINQQIKLAREQGFTVIVNEFDIDSTVNPHTNPPNQTQLLPL